MKPESPTKEPKEEASGEPTVPNVYEKPIPFFQLYMNAFRYYHRVATMVFSSDKRSYRALKVLNSFTQFSLAIAFTVGEIHIEGLGSEARAITVSFLFMRVFQPTLNFMEGCGARSGKAVYFILSGFIFLLFIAS